jgi:S1-C subfamily serine protease
MGVSTERQIPLPLQPQTHDYRYDLDRALSSVVGVKANIPDGALTAETLGTERAGNGVFIAGGVVLTIGYLITEAETVWLTLANGRVVPATPLAYDQQTGFGLVQALASVDVPALALGDSGAARRGTRVVVGGAGGRSHSIAAAIVGKQEFAGYWEYVLDEAIFTAPAHPFWGGAALIGPAGDLLGIGSLQVGRRTEDGTAEPLNMIVPIDLLKPILDDLLTTGRANRPPRPWLGLFATEIEGTIYVAGLSPGGPADRAGLRPADAVVSVAGERVAGLAGFFRRIWSLGPAGVEVPLTIERDGKQFDVSVRSADRGQFLKAPRLH